MLSGNCICSVHLISFVVHSFFLAHVRCRRIVARILRIAKLELSPAVCTQYVNIDLSELHSPGHCIIPGRSWAVAVVALLCICCDVSVRTCIYLCIHFYACIPTIYIEREQMSQTNMISVTWWPVAVVALLTWWSYVMHAQLQSHCRIYVTSDYGQQHYLE